MYKPLNILVDLDGVVANFSKRFTEMCNAKYGDRCPIIETSKDIPFWHWEKSYPITVEEIAAVWADIRKTKNFWNTLEVLNEEDWTYFVNNMCCRTNVNVYFITAREETAGDSVANQSAKWLNNIGWMNPFVIQSRQKGKLSELLDIKYVIDDKDNNLIEIHHHIDDCKLFAYPAKHNIKKLDDSGIDYSVGNLRTYTDNIVEYLKTA